MRRYTVSGILFLAFPALLPAQVTFIASSEDLKAKLKGGLRTR